MRKASTIVTWIGVVLGAFILILEGWLGIIPVTTKTYTGYYYKTETTRITPTWLWVIIVIAIILSIAVAIFREISIRRGNKVLAGVLTIIFTSKVGGILTLMIPEYQLY